jgi:hypothetical protein
MLLALQFVVGEETVMTARGVASKLFIVASFFALVLGLSARVSHTQLKYKGVPQDWSHRHLIFTSTDPIEHPSLVNAEPRLMHRLLARAKGSFRSNAAAMAAVSPAAAAAKATDWNIALGAKVLIGNAPAEFTADLANPSCTNDYVVFAVNGLGVTGGQATLIGVNGLYTGNGFTGGKCTPPAHAGPFVMFAYNTSTITQGRIRTSPVLSLDGKKIAFVEANTTTSVLHVVTWASNTTNPACGTGGTQNGCRAGQSAAPGVGNAGSMVTVTYANAANGTNSSASSPWIDYDTDTMYVGADDGAIHKITGVFNTATPTVVTTGGWPATVRAGAKLTSVVQDKISGKLFVGDNKGFLNAISYTTPGTVQSLAVGKSNKRNGIIFDAPLVDSGHGTVFVTSPNDGTSAVLVEADTTNLAQMARIRIGAGGVADNVVLYDGDVNNNYVEIGPSAGSMLVCGTDTNTAAPALYSLPFIGTTIQPDSTPQVIVNSTTARCSPITGFFNENLAGGTDFFFWGVTDTCGPSGNGCVMKMVNGGAIFQADATGGTSAIIVDQDVNGAQTSNIYFSNQTNPLRGNKLTQSNLN